MGLSKCKIDFRPECDNSVKPIEVRVCRVFVSLHACMCVCMYVCESEREHKPCIKF